MYRLLIKKLSICKDILSLLFQLLEKLSWRYNDVDIMVFFGNY